MGRGALRLQRAAGGLGSSAALHASRAPRQLAVTPRSLRRSEGARAPTPAQLQQRLAGGGAARRRRRLAPRQPGARPPPPQPGAADMAADMGGLAGEDEGADVAGAAVQAASSWWRSLASPYDQEIFLLAVPALFRCGMAGNRPWQHGGRRAAHAGCWGRQCRALSCRALNCRALS